MEMSLNTAITAPISSDDALDPATEVMLARFIALSRRRSRATGSPAVHRQSSRHRAGGPFGE